MDEGPVAPDRDRPAHRGAGRECGGHSRRVRYGVEGLGSKQERVAGVSINVEYRVVVLVGSPVRMPGIQGIDGLRQRIVLDDDLDDVQDPCGTSETRLSA
jgi:hypothetical protein